MSANADVNVNDPEALKRLAPHVSLPLTLRAGGGPGVPSGSMLTEDAASFLTTEAGVAIITESGT